MSYNLTDKVEFVTLCVNKFAQRHELSRRVACRYLYQYNGLSFLDEFYPEESTLSEAASSLRLRGLCQQGGVTW